MAHVALPDSSDQFMTAGWDDIRPYYDDLADRPLTEAATWMKEWSLLEDLLREAGARIAIEYTTDTLDAEKERRYVAWVSDIEPRLSEQRDRLARRLVESGFVAPDLEQVVLRFRNQMELFREQNLELQAELSRLESRYQKLTGGMTAEWDGERLTVPQVEAKLSDPDRSVRERAYRSYLRPYVEQRDEMASLFDEMYRARQEVARNAGFSSYRDYAHREKNRFDYTPEDCLRWHDAVEAAVVPALRRTLERRRQRMGVDRLRPWDVEGSPDPEGRPGLRPFTDVSDLIAGAGRIVGRVDGALAERFQVMVDAHMLDLESRHGKAPGGYCSELSVRKLPFIFMNAAGSQRDVDTLLHESGHGFHAFESASLPLHWQRDYGAEIAEVASMSMELLGAPYLPRSEGGFYSDEDARRARADHLEGILSLLCHIASIDAFQHWIYTDPGGADRDQRDRAWLEIRTRFQPGIDFSGLQAERVARWYKQLHLFQFPFYYIEYGLAQLGALQVWRNSLSDRPAAIRSYRHALSLGATRPLPDLFAAAGARLVFDREGMQELVGLVEEELSRLSDG
jgi:oligoendopeptidase F